MRRKLCFTKMEGCGNDYIYLDCMEWMPEDPGQLSIRLSDRHFGIGGDGLVLICPSENADARMRMFNRDGSEGRMCGNAVRCVSKYLYNRKMVEKVSIEIETEAGSRSAEILPDGRVRVEMGEAILSPKRIPVLLQGERILEKEIFVGGENRRISCISMGNPHCVIFCPDISGMEIASVGAAIEKDPLFPEQVNVEFVRIMDKTTLQMRVWERGSGETLSCGTGACAAVVAAVENGFCGQNTDITVSLPGGELSVLYQKNTVFLTGNATEVFEGIINI